MINWFRKRKKQEEEFEEFDIYNSEVPLTTLVRWFIYDTGHGDADVDELIGLAPMSEEGKEKETQDSVQRVSELYSLIPFMEFMSDAAATIFSGLGASLPEDISDEEREEMEEVLGGLYKAISLNSILGALSIANALGLIHITAISSQLGESEEVDDE